MRLNDSEWLEAMEKRRILPQKEHYLPFGTVHGLHSGVVGNGTQANDQLSRS
jgi:hypothetical protein